MNLKIKFDYVLNLQELNDDELYQLKKELNAELKRRQKRTEDPATVEVFEVFSGRTASILHWIDVRTVADLKTVSFNDLWKVRGVGHKTLKEIEQVKRNFNLI